MPGSYPERGSGTLVLISLSAVSETLRRRSLRDDGMSTAGVFLIERLEGSRFGTPALWDLKGRAGGKGWGGGELIFQKPCRRCSWEDFGSLPASLQVDADTRVALVFGHALES